MQTIELRAGDPLPEPLSNAVVYAPQLVRTSAQAGSTPDDIERVNVALGALTEHVIIHDVHDVGWWAWRPGVVQDARLYDVVVYNVGWRGLVDKDRPDGGHGMALYTQNYASGGGRVIDTCVFIAGFSLPGKVYGTNSEVAGKDATLAALDRGDGHYDLYPYPSLDASLAPFDYSSPRNKLANYTFRHSAFVGARFIIGNEGKSAVGAHNIHFEECAFLDTWLQMGYQGDNGAGSITGSFFSGGLSVQTYEPTDGEPHRNLDIDQQPITTMQSWAELDVTDNVFVLPRGKRVNVVYPGSNWNWDRNVYWSEDEKPFTVTLFKGFEFKPGLLFPCIRVERKSLTFTEWQTLTGFDANSEFHVGLPPRAYSQVYPVPEKSERIMWEWNADAAQRPATGNLYPPPDPIGWDGLAPALGVIDSRIGLWREADIVVEPEPDCAECETALATAIERIQALETELALANGALDGAQRTIADREQRIREDADVIRSLQATVVEQQVAGEENRRIHDALKVIGEVLR